MKPLILIIMDGWGIRGENLYNGIAQAQKPHFDSYWNAYPHTAIDASGPAVGLPLGIMGNSEVGHMNMGAGRIVYTGLSQIYRAIDNGSFFKNPALLDAMQEAKRRNTALHLVGLVSDGAVHSHQDHLYALLRMAKDQCLSRVFVHAIMDGRDAPPKDGIRYIDQLEMKMKAIGAGAVASVSGRYYAMDRDRRWERVEMAYDVLTGSSANMAFHARDVVSESYRQGIGDEFIIPRVIADAKGSPVGTIQDGDAVIFFNFRADRARELTACLTQEGFAGFGRKKFPRLSQFVCMAPYDESFNLPVAFVPVFPKRVFSEIVSENDLTQLHIAETEKYAHVTFFFNGGREAPFPGEERILIPSPREVPTYDLKPEMAAAKITDEVIKNIRAGAADVIIVNFANPDMVGHTAKMAPVVCAIETVDACIGRIVDAALKQGGCAVITSDHGNAEELMDAHGRPHTAHTTNLVPFIVVSDGHKNTELRSGGRLCDVAPTLLQIMGISQPKEMMGVSLLED